MNRGLAIGIDIGTTTICMIVLDAATGEILKTLTKQNDAGIKGQYAWEKLQDASVIMAQIEQMLLEVHTHYADIMCIGLTGQMHGIVYIDEKGMAVSPLFTWQDGRGNLEYQKGLSYADHLSQITGYKLAAGFGAVTHFYNTINKQVPAAAKNLCTIMDYAAMRLSNAAKPVIHPSNAASIGLFDIKRNQFNTQAIDAAGLDKTFFPAVSKSIQLMEATTLNTPISVGIGDNQASFIGAVKSSEDCLLVNIGTSSQLSVYSGYFKESSKLETRPLIDQDFILVGAPLCGGRAYALLEHFFREIVELATGKEASNLYDIMEKLAYSFETIEEPLEIATQFCGTRDNPSLRGTIGRLGTENFTAKHFTIGVLQGMAGELYELYLAAQKELDVLPKTLVGSGNGLRMNKPLQQMIAKVFNREVKIPAHKEEASYGAALFALVGTGAFESLKEAQGLIRYL
ncbi:sedoheptulokinase [Cellulosilyticum sp. I15G10I2]|uniref:sedoheptulokinase n=1 Tax=Cellulosilyticum sp. I15G10I2 TaxID=1892843 RepID=UPI00085BC42E|nr:FGGY family carbohydrate kinase [Cellulosilyticum sp. I15G10I2]